MTRPSDATPRKPAGAPAPYVARAGASRVARAVHAWRHEGLRGIWCRLLAAAGYRRLLVLARGLDDPALDTARAAAASLPTTVLTPDAIADYLAFRVDADPQEIEARWARGNLCFVTRSGTRIVSACWAATGSTWVPFLRAEFALGVDEVYFFDAFTAPDFRGRDLAPALCHVQLRHFRKAGSARALRLTFEVNAAALRAHAKSGFRPVARVTAIRLGPLRRVHRRPLASP